MTRLHRAERWLQVGVIVVFAVFAANFLYYFVDDEGIPLVYAQNLIAGRGLVYNSIEGRVEGYSDFLHVIESAGILSGVRAFGLPKITAFFVGKGISFAAGLGIVWLVLATLRRLRIGPSSSAGGLALLVLTGPLAVWSCSSLEAVPAALCFTLLAWALVAERDDFALLAATLLILERIDGFVHTGTLIAAFLVVAAPQRRRTLAFRVVAPLAVIFCAYHGWRYLYFGEWLPTPIRAKILYKLMPHGQLVEKAADQPYVLRFVNVIGWPVVVALAASAAVAVRRRGPISALALACAALVVYVSIVGDWMFGFRFFVAVLPLMAIVLAEGLSTLSNRHPRAARAAAVLSILWCAAAGASFTRTFLRAQDVDAFLSHPSRHAGAYFKPYYSLYTLARKYIPPGTIVADNQSGFVPFMLDLQNIDDLGICSRFYAALPSTDVVFTEVGRYQPLTPRRPMRPGEAYLIYQDARFLLVRGDLLRSANDSHAPRLLLGGFYEKLDEDRIGDNAIYRRTAQPADAITASPDAFAENVAHLSYVRDAMIDGVAIARSSLAERLSWLRNQTGYLHFTGRTAAAITFSEDDDAVFHLSVDSVAVDQPATLEIALRSRDGTVVAHETLALESGRPAGLWRDLPPGTRAQRLDLQIVTTSATPMAARLTDVRVLGQKATLRTYVTSRLTFPKPGT